MEIKKISKYLIYIFPFIYLILGFYFRQIFGDLSLRSTDPEYIQFLSGMCISTGQFDQANIDHPGSALQIILAVIFRIVYSFRGGTLPFFEDAMIHSDLYLSVGNLVITTIITAVILWAGKKTLKITNNYLYALLIQTSPFLINVWYEIFGRIYPELLIIVPVLLLQVQLLRELYVENTNKYKDVLVYSFAVALGMSLKMTFLPFVFIPLIVLKTVKRKLQFIGTSALFFLLISLPVTFQLEKFWNWMKGIFMHSGAYQSGDKNILDLELFFNNLKNIFVSEIQFFIALLLLVVLLVTLIIRKSNQTNKKKPLTLIGSGLFVAFMGCLFIMGKQYAVRYFVPALLFFPFLIILNFEVIKQFLKHKSILIALGVVISVFTLLNLKNQLPYIKITSQGIGKHMQTRTESRDFINTLDNDSYKLIVSQDYGCPYHEYAIMYSFCIAGKEWPGYEEKLDKIYPNTYQYFTWDNTIKYWGTEFNPKEIIESGKPVYLYLQKNTDELYNRTINKFFENHKEYMVQKKLLFENSRNGEAILQLFLSHTKDQGGEKELNS